MLSSFNRDSYHPRIILSQADKDVYLEVDINFNVKYTFLQVQLLHDIIQIKSRTFLFHCKRLKDYQCLKIWHLWCR